MTPAYLKRKRLADKLGLVLLVDIRQVPKRYPPQFIIPDQPAAEQIRFLPKAHWKVVR